VSDRSATRTLSERLSAEADLCRNEGAADIAALLDEAAVALAARDEYAAQVRTVLEAHCADLTECAKKFREAGMALTANQTCLAVYELRELLEKEPK
jgi:hypothetical protein